MKRVLLLIKVFAIALFIGIGNQGVGQTPGAQSIVKEIGNPGNIYTQQIEGINSDTSIILSQSSDQSHFDFYLVDENSNIVKHVSIPGQYIVKEFEILGNFIYFCGSIMDVNSSCGFIAQTKINSLFNYNLFDWDSIQGTSVVNKIEVIDENGEAINTIVGIGLKPNGSSIFVYLPNGDGYNIYDSPISSEIFDDLLLKNDFSFPSQGIFQNIFIVSRAYNGQRIIVRKFDMYNFSIANSQNYYYHLLNNLNITAPYPLVADSFFYKFIAVAGIVRNTNGSEETNVYQISIFGPPNAYNFTMYQVQSYGNYNIGEAKIRDIMFDGIDQNNYNLLVLEDAILQSNPLNAIYSLNMAPNNYYPYEADVLYSEIYALNYPFNCLSSFNYKNFIATGIKPYNNNIHIWNANRDLLGGNCNLLIREPINLLNYPQFTSNFSWINTLNVLPIGGSHCLWKNEHVNVDNNSITKICN